MGAGHTNIQDCIDLFRYKRSIRKFPINKKSDNPAYLTDKENNELYLKDGKAYNKDNTPYSGCFIYKIPKKNIYFDIEYKDGELSRSTRNNSLYKTYEQEAPCPFYKTFNDHSSIPYNQLWKIRREDIKHVVDHKNNRHYYYFAQDNKPVSYIYVNQSNNTCNIYNPKDDICFESVEEAQDYFKEKYGIEAQFKDIFQAVILKQAVDEYIEIDPMGNKEKLFDGLKVINNGSKMKKTEIAQMTGDRNLIGERFDNLTLEFNEFYDWSDSKNYKLHKDNIHPTYLYKGNMMHELTHYIMMKYFPDLCFVFELHYPELDEIETMKQVSGYAASNFDEFIAEYNAGLAENKKFPESVHQLYKSIGAPKLV